MSPSKSKDRLSTNVPGIPLDDRNLVNELSFLILLCLLCLRYTYFIKSLVLSDNKGLELISEEDWKWQILLGKICIIKWNSQSLEVKLYIDINMIISKTSWKPVFVNQNMLYYSFLFFTNWKLQFSISGMHVHTLFLMWISPSITR